MAANVAAAMNTIMMVSSYSSTRLEEIAASLQGRPVNLWMQTYIFGNRKLTVDIVRKAERSGYKAIVLTVDSNAAPKKLCDVVRDPVIADFPMVNGFENDTFDSLVVGITTAEDIKWLRSITNLPIVAKGVLTGRDAIQAISAGASAILVSNHGGRQLDSVPASIDALPGVVTAVKRIYPRIDVYLDSGIRNGFDVYKALARGAKMVFIGRPVLWGLALEGDKGVTKVISILKEEFNTTMLLAGASNPSKISKESITSIFPDFP